MCARARLSALPEGRGGVSDYGVTVGLQSWKTAAEQSTSRSRRVSLESGPPQQ